MRGWRLKYDYDSIKRNVRNFPDLDVQCSMNRVELLSLMDAGQREGYQSIHYGGVKFLNVDRRHVHQKSLRQQVAMTTSLST